MPTDGTDRSPPRPDGGSANEDAPTEANRDGKADDPAPERVVEVAAAAAEDVVFARVDAGDVADLDVTVSFEQGVLDVDVYLTAPESRSDEQQVADDAAMAARSAVDDLF